MKRKFLRGLAAAVTCGFFGSAHAVPMYFDFSGAMFGTGEAVSGGFNFETDRLLFAEPVVNNQYTWVDWAPTDPVEPLAFLNFGGREIRHSSGDPYYNLVTFADHCTADPCPAGGDNINLFSSSSTPHTADFTGSYSNSTIMVLLLGPSTVSPGQAPQYLDYFSGPAARPSDLVTLPLHLLIGIYSETVWDCVAGDCTASGGVNLNFSLDTVSRGAGPRAVPEPGTLALFGVALAGACLLRRRKAALLQR